MERVTLKSAAPSHDTNENMEMLAEKLRQTEAVLRRVTAERDKLISISNMLRADLKRAHSSALREPLAEVQTSPAQP
eukprot:CAMPEP_0179466868 /NCGR_PEP_ID=MMETSP0799-20121207/48116_1 /TAXON_ID=46947 /ORGANISM="Geminigera cryophila, Strain CCMP2564" /LENGTH=76 /DNA_ID=CAMNT_0021271945 /DNA_START=15 /DNA_END=241 /DNA_ORIENTATION=+